MSKFHLFLPFTLVLVATFGMLFIMFLHQEKSAPRRYTYLGNDYPRQWAISPLQQIHFSQENTVHYAFNTEQARLEWNTTLPSGGAVVYLGPERRPFTVGMLHQIRCLGIIREVLDAYYQDPSPDRQFERPQIVRHCINYLRQMILCNADTHLESIRADNGTHLSSNQITRTCRDFSSVYTHAEQNYRENNGSLGVL